MPHKVNVYSFKYDGNVKLSTHFKLNEFRCKDLSDVVFIDYDLVELLERIRSDFNSPLIINSGYRTVSYNKKIDDSASYSKHCMGLAADIAVNGYSALEVAKSANENLINTGGVILYKNFVHVDTRYNMYRYSKDPNNLDWWK